MRPECRSYRCHFHIRSCLTSCFTFYSFFTTLVATRRRRCLLRSVWVTLCLNGCSLWSRGSWLGESLVSALSFVASITLLPGPFVWFCVFFCLLLFRWPSHNDTQDVIVHVIPIAGSDPTSLCFWFVLVLLWLCVFCLLGCFCFLFVFCLLLGQLIGLRTGPLPVLLWLSTSRQPCMIITIHLFAAIERV